MEITCPTCQKVCRQGYIADSGLCLACNEKQEVRWTMMSQDERIADLKKDVQSLRKLLEDHLKSGT